MQLRLPSGGLQDLHDLARVFGVGCVLCDTDPAPDLMTAGKGSRWYYLDKIYPMSEWLCSVGAWVLRVDNTYRNMYDKL